MSHHEDLEIRESLRVRHEESMDETPSFSTVWARAALCAPAARRSRVARRAAAASLIALAGIAGAWRVLGPATERPKTAAPDVLRLAASVDDWQTPLDFLLRTPGQELFESLPFLEAPPRLMDPETLSEPG